MGLTGVIYVRATDEIVGYFFTSQPGDLAKSLLSYPNHQLLRLIVIPNDHASQHSQAEWHVRKGKLERKP